MMPATETNPVTDTTLALVETMPLQHRESHRAAGNWGRYPGNGSERAWMPAASVELDDEGEYDRVVRTVDVAGMTVVADCDCEEDSDTGRVMRVGTEGITVGWSGHTSTTVGWDQIGKIKGSRIHLDC